MHWNSDVVEGNVNRLKTIKRKLYGAPPSPAPQARRPLLRLAPQQAEISRNTALARILRRIGRRRRALPSSVASHATVWSLVACNAYST
jgi:hypothetical protein